MTPGIILVLHLILASLVAGNALKNDRTSNKTLAVLVLYLVPFFGILIYYAVLQSRKKARR